MPLNSPQAVGGFGSNSSSIDAYSTYTVAVFGGFSSNTFSINAYSGYSVAASTAEILYSVTRVGIIS